MKYEAIIFDWDGTLVDSAQRIVESMQDAAKDLGLSYKSDDEVRQIIGLGLPEAIVSLWQDLDVAGSVVAEIAQRYHVHYMADTRPLTVFFDSAIELLENIEKAGLDLAVATGKSRKGLDRAFRDLKIGHMFRDSRCADETKSKPDPLMLHELASSLGVEPSAMLMVGDTEFDINMAKAAGVDAVAIGHGAHDETRLRACEPLIILDDLPALISWLNDAGLNNK